MSLCRWRCPIHNTKKRTAHSTANTPTHTPTTVPIGIEELFFDAEEEESDTLLEESVAAVDDEVEVDVTKLVEVE